MRLNLVLTTLFLIFDLSSAAARVFKRRGQANSDPQLSEYGFTVPLQGSETCSASNYCTNSLLPPSTDKSLKYLALARGMIYYNCASKKPTESPVFMSQETTLWDAAPLLPQVHTEELFHTLVPQLFEFDYASLKNSSLICLGEVTSNKVENLFTITDVVAFPARVQGFVNAPNEPEKNLGWARSVSSDLAWEIYRVETKGGTVPSSCKGQKDHIQLDYAAEYWFYHE